MRHAGPNNLRLLGQVCTNNDDARFNLNNLPCLPGQKNPCGQWLSHPNFGACFVGVQTICCAQPHIPKIDCTQCTQCRHFLQARVAFTRQWQMFQNTPYPSNVYIYIYTVYIYIYNTYTVYIYISQHIFFTSTRLNLHPWESIGHLPMPSTHWTSTGIPRVFPAHLFCTWTCQLPNGSVWKWVISTHDGNLLGVIPLTNRD